MKTCLGLIAALGLATVTSAANMTWSSTTVPGSQEIFGSSDAKADFALAVKITTDFAGKTLSNTNMLTFGNNLTDGSPAGLLAYSNTNGFGAHFDSGTVSNRQTWTDNASNLVSGSHIVVINGAWDATNSRWNVTLYIDGTTPIEFNSGDPILGLTGGTLTATFASNAAWTFDEAATYDGTLTTEEIAQLVNGETAVLPTNVPEPTALALLALGVAGIALRRRVA